MILRMGYPCGQDAFGAKVEIGAAGAFVADADYALGGGLLA